MGTPTSHDVIILGAGGAGLMAATTVGRGGARVLLLDHAEKVGKKILISGGGRCNFTNLHCSPENFLSDNPHFVKSALKRYSQWDFIQLVDQYGIAWHEKTLGQLFCDGSSKQIVQMLLEECRKGNVDIRLNAEAADITRRGEEFRVAGARAQNLMVATGGPSIPKMGATGRAYEIARQFGLNVVEPRPALVPFTLSEEDKLFKTISGISVPSVAKVNGVSFEEATLFTHRGLSGPAILQVSSYWRKGEAVHLNLLPDAVERLKTARSNMPRAHLKAALSGIFPDRLAEALAVRIGITKELGNVSNAEIDRIAAFLTDLIFVPNGTEGYAKAEVTAGGIDTDELSSKTMETKKVPGLYFIGEAVDVTGWLGGFNFQWAWSSGVAAGRAVLESIAAK